MNFVFNALSELLTSVANGAVTCCAFIFFEPEIPEALREEQ